MRFTRSLRFAAPVASDSSLKSPLTSLCSSFRVVRTSSLRPLGSTDEIASAMILDTVRARDLRLMRWLRGRYEEHHARARPARRASAAAPAACRKALRQRCAPGLKAASRPAAPTAASPARDARSPPRARYGEPLCP